jgi:hypothetical protein
MSRKVPTKPGPVFLSSAIDALLPDRFSIEREPVGIDRITQLRCDPHLFKENFVFKDEEE